MPTLLPRRFAGMASIIHIPALRPSLYRHEVGNRIKFTRLHLGSLALRPISLSFRNLRPLITQTQPLRTIKANGQLLERDFKPLAKSLLLRTSEPRFIFLGPSPIARVCLSPALAKPAMGLARVGEAFEVETASNPRWISARRRTMVWPDDAVRFPCPRRLKVLLEPDRTGTSGKPLVPSPCAVPDSPAIPATSVRYPLPAADTLLVCAEIPVPTEWRASLSRYTGPERAMLGTCMK